MGSIESTIVDARIPSGHMSVLVRIGRNFLDGSWHVAWIDLPQAVQDALATYEGGFGDIIRSDWEIVTAERIGVYGQMFRLDDIIFRLNTVKRLGPLNLMEPGPRYTQIFEPCRHLFMADYHPYGNIPMFTDLLLDPSNFITEPDNIRDAWIADLLRINPNYHVIDQGHPLYDPNYTNRWFPGDPDFGKPDPVAGLYLGEGFFIDCTLPVFSDQNFRIDGNKSAEMKEEGTLGWNVTIGGYGKDGIQAFMIHPLPINPYDGMPTYIFTYIFTYSACISIIRKYGKPHYGPEQSLTLESALWISGVTRWPNIAYIDFEPQYFEDLIITIEATDGSRSDVSTFPVSVVNYPVENYSPVVQLNITRKAFMLGEEEYYTIRFADPDCFIFSLAQFMGRTPSTTHLPMLPGNRIREDQDNLIYQMTLNGLPVYQYGPWREELIDPRSGLITFMPRFEGILEAAVTCTDAMGLSGFGSVRLYWVNPGSWFNHCPIIYVKTPKPLVMKAGEEFILSPTDLNIVDPDGDEIYASCNFGAVGRTNDGGLYGRSRPISRANISWSLFFMI